MAGDPVPLADAGIEACSVTGEAGRGVAERGSPEPTPASGGARGGPSTVGSQVEVQVARAAQGRIERLVVQLEPADLGRVEIRLEFGQEGRVALSISAERPETLDVLQRDAAALERSLRDAGLRPDAGGLSFGLKRDQGEGAGRGDLAARGAAEPLRTEAEPAGPARGLASLRLLDIRA